MKRGIKAWLVIWDWCGDHAARPNEEKVVAILNSRHDSRFIADFLYYTYHQHTFRWEEMSEYAGRIAHYRRKGQFDYPKTLQDGKMTIGHNPFLVAKFVSNLRITFDLGTQTETLHWVEGPYAIWGMDDLEPKRIPPRTCQHTRRSER